jgi:hypothetical protein
MACRTMCDRLRSCLQCGFGVCMRPAHCYASTSIPLPCDLQRAAAAMDPVGCPALASVGLWWPAGCARVTYSVHKHSDTFCHKDQKMARRMSTPSSAISWTCPWHHLANGRECVRRAAAARGWLHHQADAARLEAPSVHSTSQRQGVQRVFRFFVCCLLPSLP